MLTTLFKVCIPFAIVEFIFIDTMKLSGHIVSFVLSTRGMLEDWGECDKYILTLDQSIQLLLDLQD